MYIAFGISSRRWSDGVRLHREDIISTAGDQELYEEQQMHLCGEDLCVDMVFSVNPKRTLPRCCE
jgi:hypothetical protein